MLFSLCSAFGQLFIFWTIREFDSLTLSTITTTRKFFTIVTSVVFHGHVLTQGQWVAVGVVFAGLALETVEKEWEKRSRSRSREMKDAVSPAAEQQAGRDARAAKRAAARH